MIMMEMNFKYITPAVEVIEIAAEGVLCESGTESLTEKEGIW